ncbi:MAG TPA: MBL fold metallo-hydrolase [Actinomycetota bacterium]|nr:MBL fold metallo-hydrolase [Actinomycetota bacterium]
MPREHRRREPAPGIFRLVLPLPVPELDRVNAYLLVGDEPILVDCGMYSPDEAKDHGWSEIEAAFAAHGMSPGDVKHLLITHPHIDHYGMAGRFVAETGCDLWMHQEAESDLEMYRNPRAVVDQLRAMFKDHGVSGDALDELLEYEDVRILISDVIEPDRALKGGERFKVGDREWEVVFTPGHSRAHVCPWSADDRILISGDHLLPTITPHIDFKRGEDEDPLGDFLESLAKVERLDPSLVLPGHGHPFEEGAERARIIERHHDRRLGSIVQVIRNEPQTAEQITNEIFGTELLHFQKRLALGEALAHLAYLRQRGEVERIKNQDGVYVYKKVSRKQQS